MTSSFAARFSRDFDVIAVAIQNTADEENRVAALAALARIKTPEVEGEVPSSWYLDEKLRADALRAALVVITSATHAALAESNPGDKA